MQQLAKSVFITATLEEDEDEIAVRHLHLWSDGFSIEDGPLLRYDEPGNQELLMSIRQGYVKSVITRFPHPLCYIIPQDCTPCPPECQARAACQPQCGAEDYGGVCSP